MIHAVEPSHFVRKVDAHQLHSAEQPNEGTTVGHGPQHAGDGADYLLSDDVSAAVADAAVQDASARLWDSGEGCNVIARGIWLGLQVRNEEACAGAAQAARFTFWYTSRTRLGSAKNPTPMVPAAAFHTRITLH
jgi:hypothetical protein